MHFHTDLQELVVTHGYWVVALIVGLESMGVPLPGETILVLASIYAAADPSLNIWLVILAASIGAIIGDNIGFWIGYRYAYRLLLRYGRHVGVSEARIKVGQYLFRSYGGAVVFFGRFVALLRILAAVLAGANRMPWPRFLVANAAGGIVWAGVFGLSGYWFGRQVFRLEHHWAPFVIGGSIALFLGVGFLLRRYESRLIEVAEKAIPGRLEDSDR